jgi:NADH dehydrogenase
VGGGFGGVKAALELCEDRRFKVTLVSSHGNFRYYPTLYRTATGGRKMISSIPLAEIFAGKHIEVIEEHGISIDRKTNTLITESGNQLPFDALILALGVKTNYFGIKGLKEYSFGIKTVAEAEELKRHLHSQLIKEKRPDLNYVVVGGGPTGVELAGALPVYLREICIRHNLKPQKIHIDLVEAAPRLLPRMPKDISRKVARRLRRLGIKLYLGTAVEAETVDALMVKGKPIRSHTVIWTAGVVNNDFFAKNQFQLARNGKVRVDQYLQAEPGIYVIGDNADTAYSGLAQTALNDALSVTNNLKRLADNKSPVPCPAKRPIYVTPAGPRWASVLWGPFRIYGIAGWLLRRVADLRAYHDFEPWQIATKRWMSHDDEEIDCPHCADDLADSVFLATKS